MRFLIVAFLFCLVSATGITAQSSCPAGGKIVSNSCTSCPGCPPCPTTGCTPCAAGETSFMQKTVPSTLSSCMACSSGTMSVSGGSPVSISITASGYVPNCQTTCAAGTYRLSATSSVCAPCQGGSYNLVASSTLTSCNICPAGKYCPQTPCTSTYSWATVCNNGVAIGTIQPITCPSGMMSPTGAMQCSTTCPAGSYRSSSAACQPCRAGTYQSGATAVISNTCPTCAEGYVSVATGASECTPCSAGSEPVPSKAKCRTCIPGTFNSSPASTCQQCPVDTYAGGYGSLSCTPCPEGTSTAGATGASTCA